jgi:histidinol-phosphatase
MLPARGGGAARVAWDHVAVTHADPDDLALALALADQADQVTLTAFRRADLHVETKPDLTPVSDADQETERLIRASLAVARPDDAVLGEEYGTSGSGDRRWVIDPIDGTQSYVRGLPAWATLIALEVDGELVVGVASAPALDRRWWAGRRLGAWAGPTDALTASAEERLAALDLSAGASGRAPATVSSAALGEAIRVSGIRDLADAQLSGSTLDHWDGHAGVDKLVDLARRCKRDRGYGDFWSHCLVAEGAVDIGLDPIASYWDLAAVAVIVEEAGGRFTDLSGARRADGGSGVSTNGALHDEVLGILAGAPAPAGP